jgi:hypothetical protein
LKPWIWVLALVAAAPGAAAAGTFESRVMIIDVDAPSDLDAALTAGAQRVSPAVTRSTSSLDDTATLVGCTVTAAGCYDDIAAALNVDQLLIAESSESGTDTTVKVIAVTRETEPVVQTFVLHEASRANDLAKLQGAVPGMLEAGEAKRDPPPPPHDGDGHHEEPHVAVVTHPAKASPVGLFVGAGGAVLMAAGGIAWVMAASTQSEIDAAPTATAADLDHLAALEHTARVRATAGNVLFIGGAVAAAAGIGWYVYARGHAHAEVEVAPAPGGAAVTLEGVW